MKRKATGSSTRPTKKARTSTNRARPPRAFKDELKYTTYSIAAVQQTWTGAVQSLYGNLSRGDAGRNNYDGNMVKPRSITVRLNMVPGGVTDILRVIVVQQIRGPAPTVAQLLDLSGGTAQQPIASYNRPYKRSIKVLADRLYDLSSSFKGEYTDTIYIKGKKLVPLEVLSTAQTIITGDILLYTYAQSATGATMSMYSEITYTD